MAVMHATQEAALDRQLAIDQLRIAIEVEVGQHAAELWALRHGEGRGWPLPAWANMLVQEHCARYGVPARLKRGSA